jgi:hypothetical protein
MTKVQEQCTAMVMSAAFWAAVRGRMTDGESVHAAVRGPPQAGAVLVRTA